MFHRAVTPPGRPARQDAIDRQCAEPVAGPTRGLCTRRIRIPISVADLDARGARGDFPHVVIRLDGPAYDRAVDALELRVLVYRHFVATGFAPTRQRLGELVGDLETADGLLRELHDRHMLVLDDRSGRQGEIRMALPFAAEPTNFRVATDHGAWWANCAWDSLAILAALHSDGRIRSTWSDTGEPIDLTVTDGELDDTAGYISFPLPASRWWDDIVFT